MDFLGLTAIQGQAAGNLPLGSQKRLELARALALEPELLLLDGPASGLNVSETQAFARVLLEVRNRFKLTILLVEHDMGLVMNISDTITVVNFGRKIAEGAARPAERPGSRQGLLGESAGVDAR
jgi:branched-chain amino acid transport system ATP-binding protein